MAQTTHYSITKPPSTWSELHPGKGPEEMVAEALDNADAAIFATLGAAATVNFADAEVPGGALNGSNTAYTLAHSPNPAASLQLYYAPDSTSALLLLTPTTDYGITGAAITTNGFAPVTGGRMLAFYRY
jgi:hypothetical protein